MKQVSICWTYLSSAQLKALEKIAILEWVSDVDRCPSVGFIQFSWPEEWRTEKYLNSDDVYFGSFEDKWCLQIVI